uniref:RRM domain-containing protein n=1 Tax=Chromera velia CCMP2878 TaxID=1169474 RepID=A0A0G4GU83_9ALVE|mmetsp:Transcript_29198/g.57258  ORF Transcript_29198/g.57258 Transcript_29198/m.57258 type:complete len:717 (-) Transcript_29198:2578-4728(-)|eukprot:Cvel_5211.t1-p1 / transcript=Cvel_5211.t1 / gene=Cvel_5211 / organism=Chromera_velia_CCMP2878 / gene_product=Splicing factor U2af large subunit B, putative / transcript_product=Splicing factor U2af large subunit B, putative / location=Cvel_scaffold240:17932-21243(+) / protein_length=716 / sequence_SO=supercontig / SO=protein_coding / is_pseudo=false
MGRRSRSRSPRRRSPSYGRERDYRGRDRDNRSPRRRDDVDRYSRRDDRGRYDDYGRDRRREDRYDRYDRDRGRDYDRRRRDSPPRRRDSPPRRRRSPSRSRTPPPRQRISRDKSPRGRERAVGNTKPAKFRFDSPPREDEQKSSALLNAAIKDQPHLIRVLQGAHSSTYMPAAVQAQLILNKKSQAAAAQAAVQGVSVESFGAANSVALAAERAAQAAMASGIPAATSMQGSAPAATLAAVQQAAAQVSGGAGLATQATIDVDAEELIPLRKQMFLEVSITGIPLGMDVLSVTSFLNKAMESSKLTMGGGDACVGGWISTDGAAAYVQMRSIEEATSILSLNGIPLMHNPLKIVRPPPLVELQAAEQAREQLGLMFKGSRPERVWISGLTKEYTPVFFKQILQAFGTVQYFYMPVDEKDPERPHLGCALVEWERYCQQHSAMEILQGVEFRTPSGKPGPEGGLSLKLAADALQEPAGALRELLEESLGYKSGQRAAPRMLVPTRILYLENAVSREELVDDEVYDEIYQDIKMECAEKAGEVLDCIIPRPEERNPLDPVEAMEKERLQGVGYCFIEFASVEGAVKARKMLEGRRFGNNYVRANYLSEKKYLDRDFENPQPNTNADSSSSSASGRGRPVGGDSSDTKSAPSVSQERDMAAGGPSPPPEPSSSTESAVPLPMPVSADEPMADAAAQPAGDGSIPMALPPPPGAPIPLGA